jgi:hypothetical protein
MTGERVGKPDLPTSTTDFGRKAHDLTYTTIGENKPSRCRRKRDATKPATSTAKT